MQSSSFNPTNPTSSAIRFCTLSLGIFFLLLGLAGFVPAFVSPPMGATAFGYGNLFGIFPTNYFHNAIGILIGVWGIAAFTSLSGSIVYNRIFAIVHVISAILGLFPIANTLFGTMPLYGNNVWLNVLVAAIAFYFGFVKPSTIDIAGPSNPQPSL